MKRLFFALLVVCLGFSSADAAVLVMSTNGTYVSKTSLAAAAVATDAVGKTVVVTTPQVVTTAIAWPADRELKIEKGGYVTFTGSGALTGLKEAKPEWFNVTGTDDHTPIQKAINAAAKIVMDGTYYLGAGVTIPSNKEITGTGTITRKTGSGVYDIITNSDTTGGNVNIKISGITIDGNKDADSLVATDVNDRFSGIKFVKVTGDSAIQNMTITGTVNNETGGAIYLSECSDVVVSDNITTANDRTGIVLRTNTRCTISGNKSYSNSGSGITGSENVDCIYTKNITHTNGSGGTYTGINASGTGSVVTSNISHTNTGSGITIGDGVYTGFRSVVANNECYDNTLDGVSVSGLLTSNVQVSDNVLYSNIRRGVWIGVGVTRANSTAYALAAAIQWTEPTRVSNTAYNMGDAVRFATSPYLFQITTAGTTAASQPAVGGLGIGQTVTDGTAVWTIVSFATTSLWECTTAGTTAAAAPSIVGKVVGDTIADGTAVFTMRKATGIDNVIVSGNIIKDNDGHGIFLDSGGGHLISANTISNNGLSGVFAETSSNLSTISNNTIYNNGRITTANSAGVILSNVGRVEVSNNKIYDDQAASATQESSIWLASGTEIVISGNVLYPIKTNYVRETSSPSWSAFSNKYGTDKLHGLVLNAGSAASFTVSNNNTVGMGYSGAANRIKVWPANAGGVSRYPYVSTITAGSGTFTITVPAGAAGTDGYYYEIDG